MRQGEWQGDGFVNVTGVAFRSRSCAANSQSCICRLSCVVAVGVVSRSWTWTWKWVVPLQRGFLESKAACQLAADSSELVPGVFGLNIGDLCDCQDWCWCLYIFVTWTQLLHV